MFFDIETHKNCFKTNADEACFWHGRTNGCGGQDVAMDIATENSGKTLEMCMLDHRGELEKVGVQFLDRPDGTVEIFYGSNQEENYKFWEDCSKSFAEQASGDIHVIEGSDLRPNGQSEAEYPSVYNRIEHPTLEQNQNINGIVHVNPENGKTTGYEPIVHNNSNQNKGKGNGSNDAQSNSPVDKISDGGGSHAPPDKNGEKPEPKSKADQSQNSNTSLNKSGEKPDQTDKKQPAQNTENKAQNGEQPESTSNKSVSQNEDGNKTNGMKPNQESQKDDVGKVKGAEPEPSKSKEMETAPSNQAATNAPAEKAPEPTPTPAPSNTMGM